MKKENEDALIIERIFNAPREKVWQAWTDPELMKKWWGPKGFTAPHAEIDFKVGGKYLFAMRGKAGPDQPVRDFWSTGAYKEIIPREKIVMSDSFADEKGNVVPATYYGMSPDFPLEMKVKVIFEDASGKTKMKLKHKGMPASDQEGARMGWSQSFDKLEKLLPSIR